MRKGGKKLFGFFLALALCLTALVACSPKVNVPDVLDYGDPDLTGLKSDGLEAAANYQTRYKNGEINIGDVMPFYENGVYSFFYLAEADNHPVYRVDTTDFIHYTERGEVLAPGGGVARDSMIGTGSVVKANGDYYFFYTGSREGSPEVIMLAKSVGNIDNFNKVSEFRLAAEDLSGCDLDGYDFRDPEALFDGEKFIVFVSAKRAGKPVVARFDLSLDLSQTEYKGVVFEPNVMDGNVPECSDVFKIGDKWYLTYSMQITSRAADGAEAIYANVGLQGKMYYAYADSIDGPFTEIADPALDGVVLYAAKTAQNGDDTYLAGWARKKGSNTGYQYKWGGNLVVHQLTANADGTLNVALPESVKNYYSVERELDESVRDDELEINGIDLIVENYDLHTVSKEYSSYMLTAKVKFDGEVEEFGFAQAVSSGVSGIMETAFVPAANKIRSGRFGGSEQGSKKVMLYTDTEYDITLLVEGSVTSVYVNNSVAYTSRIHNVGNKNVAVWAKGGEVNFSDFHLYTPSDYVDTLNSGANGLKVISGGNELSGNAREVNVTPDSPAKISYTAENENFVRYTAAVYAPKEITVKAVKGEEVLSEQKIASASPTHVIGSLYMKKGETVTIEFSSAESVTALINASFETDKKPFGDGSATELFAADSAAFTAGTRATYGYTASLYFDGEISGNPVFEAGASAVMITNGQRLVTVRGAVSLLKGETLNAAVMYKTFTDGIAAQKVALTVYEVKRGEFSAGVGTLTQAKANACVMVREIVPTYRGEFSVDGDRGLTVAMNNDSFGDQGKSGFVYAYGRAGDELKPMNFFDKDYDKEYLYIHTVPSVNDNLQVKADYFKQSGGYASALVWIVPKDGLVNVFATYTKHVGDENSSAVVAEIWKNQRLVAQGIATDENDRVELGVGALELGEVKNGDSIALVVHSADLLVPACSGNYTFGVTKYDGKPIINYDPNAPAIATLPVDFDTAAQNEFGWNYYEVDYNFGDNTINALNPLTGDENGWSKGGYLHIDAAGTVKGERTAVAWLNYSSEEIEISFGGSITAVNPNTNANYRLLVKRENGYEFLGDGFNKANFTLPGKGLRLGAGEGVVLVLYDNMGDGLNLDLKVGTRGEFDADASALTRVLNSAKAINDDGTYTADSYAALQTAIGAVEAATPVSYAEITAAIASIKTALSALVFDTSVARGLLDAQIERYAEFDGKTILGGDESLTAAYTAATTVKNNPDATSEELTAAANALKAELDKAKIKIAEFDVDKFGGQGDGGWIYARANVVWDPQGVTALNEMTKNGETWESGDSSIDADGVIRGNDTAVAWRNYTAGKIKLTLRVAVTSKQTGGDMYLRAYMLYANGSTERIREWKYTDSVNDVIENLELNTSDTFVLVFFDDRGGCELSLEIGCNDALDVDLNGLNAAIASADEIDDLSGYTDETAAAFETARTEAKAVASSQNPTAGEVYRAIAALKKAQINLTEKGIEPNTSHAEVTSADSGWTVYQIDIFWNGDSGLGDRLDLDGYGEKPFTLGGDGWSYGDGDSVSSVKTNGGKLEVKAKQHIALVFEVRADGDYTLGGTYVGATRNNMRIFKADNGSKLFTYNDGWVGTDESFTKTFSGLKKGDRIAIHIESVTEAELTFDFTRSA